MEPPGRFALVLGVLRAEPEHPGTQSLELRVVVAEGARLRRTAAGARDLVPAPRQVATGPARHRVAVEEGSPREGRKVYGLSRRRCQGDRGEAHPLQVVRGPVVGR